MTTTCQPTIMYTTKQQKPPMYVRSINIIFRLIDVSSKWKITNFFMC